MALTVEIVSREMVKPSSPTPPSLGNYKLSHMDQLCPHQYVPYLLFYSNTTTTTTTTTTDHDDDHHRVKKALAETLTYMYPLAGRVNEDGGITSIDCNDRGAEYIVTCINESMSTVLENPKTHLLQQLLPLTLSPRWRSTSTTTGSQPLVSLQINHFSCSGVAIGACIRHIIADACAASAFLRMWAAISCGDTKYVPRDKVGGNIIFTGRTALFPPLNNLEVLDIIWKEDDHSIESHVNKLLLFDGPKVAALREKVRLMENPTRVQAVTAFLWAAIISVARDRNQELEMHSLSTAVNLRKKVDPPLPAYSMGNIFHATTAIWKASTDDQTKIKFDELVQELKKSINMVTEDTVRKIHEDGDQYFTNMIAGLKFMATSTKLETYGTSSWCRFPFYETDFGWGKPIWVATLAPVKNVAILFDTRDGAGIQVWLSLRKQDMEKLEQDSSFLTYVSSIHTL